MADPVHRERTLVLFIAAIVALNYPLLAVFDHMPGPAGLPPLCLYLFSVWLMIIVLTAWLMIRTGKRDGDR